MNTDYRDKRTTNTTPKAKFSQVLNNFYISTYPFPIHPPSIHEYTREKIFPVDHIKQHYCTIHIWGLFFKVTTAREEKGSLVPPGMS